MTPSAKSEWWADPRIVLPCVAVFIVMVALFTPQSSEGRAGDSRLSSHLSGSLGAQLLADVSQRLGWRVIKRDDSAIPVATPGRTIHAVLAPPIAPTPAEAHAYMDAVRAGDGLLIALDKRNPLSDSLGVKAAARGDELITGAASGCASGLDIIPPLWPDGNVHLTSVIFLRPVASHITFASLKARAEFLEQSPAAVGFELAKGRVVVVGDPDLLRNDVLRKCEWNADVLAVRMLEWLRVGSSGQRTTIAFDEYHQGYGSRSSVAGVSVSFLFEHPFGRAILVCVAAGLILLLASAPRPLPPQHLDHVERRNPLEQIDALASAYQRVHATRTVTSRLLHGIRWRIERRPSERVRPDVAFLDAAAVRYPEARADVEMIKRALDARVNDSELAKTGAALHRLEQLLLTTQ